MMTIPTLVIGAGQAGLALSHHLGEAGHPHVLLERGRVAERWRSERWASLHLLTPNWLNTLPGSAPHADANGFLSRREFVSYLDGYAEQISAPVVTGATVTSVERAGDGYVVRAGRDRWMARDVVLASGDLGAPNLPTLVAEAPRGIVQLHSSQYRSPDELPPGGVLIVGAGSSGQQIALELRRAGRDVVLSAGGHARMLRRYRGRDAYSWLKELGDLERPMSDPSRRRSFSLSGVDGGQQIDLGVLHAEGVTVAGRLDALDGARARFRQDLALSTLDAETRMNRLLARIDALVGEWPGPHPEPEPVAPVLLPPGPEAIDVERRGISVIVWATGFRPHFSYLHVPGALDARGALIQQEGVTRSPGLYSLGIKFQRRFASHIIGGVGGDAALIADRIVESSPRRNRGWLRRAA